MPLTLKLAFLATGLFLGMILCAEIGRRMGARRLAADPEGARAGAGVVEGAVFALLGLLVAFTFSGAAGRFDTRRQLVVEEANAIGTAYLRLDLLLSEDRGPMQGLFRDYLDSRLAVYRALPDVDAARSELARSAELQSQIWRSAVASAAKVPDPRATMLLLPALNQMIDITTTRTMATQIHPPTIIFVMLVMLALASSLMAGYGMAGGRARSWIRVISFALVTAGTFYVILDIEYPRLGLIRVDAIDRVLVDLRESMK